MKKIYFSLFLACISFSFLQAQTKLVAHKSHGGTNANFSKALHNELFVDILLSDFGGPVLETRKELIYTLDSLTYQQDSTFLLVFSTRNIHYDWTDEKKLSEHRYDIRQEVRVIPELLQDPKMKDSLARFLVMPGNREYILDSLQLVNFEQIQYETPSKAALKKMKKKKRKKLKKQKRKMKKEMKKRKDKKNSSAVLAFPTNNEPPSNPAAPVIPSKIIFLLSILSATLLVALCYKKWMNSLVKA